MTKEMERIKEIEAKKEELRARLDAEGITAEEISGIQEEARSLSDEERALRTKMDLRDSLLPKAPHGDEAGNAAGEAETRARALADTGRIELRALLSTGQIASPTKAAGINGMADTTGSIVDDIKGVPLTGNGAYIVAYQKSAATAADLTDGDEIGGTQAEFGYVTINPLEWATTGSVSKQLSKVSPLAYLQALETAALAALRAKAEGKVYAAVLKSGLLGTAQAALDADYLRDVVMGHTSIKGKGGVKLYLNRADLVILGKVRGTHEKKPLYEIKFDDGTNISGVISEGGIAVPFSVTEQLPAGTQLFGQPQTIEMPMWDNYKIETDDSVFFTKNLTAYRGVQTANADLCALNGMKKIVQQSAPESGAPAETAQS